MNVLSKINPQDIRKLVKNRIGKPSPRISPTSMIRPGHRAVWALAAIAGLAALSGCGTNPSSKPQVGPIAFTDANGNPVAATAMLKTGQGIYLDVVVGNDPQMLGVNWTVTCSSQLPPGTPLPPGQTVDESCGFFTPPHTLSAPVPITASNGTGIVTFYQAPAAQPNPAIVTLYASSALDPTKFTSITLSIMP
jgi:hypothetical protein